MRVFVVGVESMVYKAEEGGEVRGGKKGGRGVEVDGAVGWGV